MREGHARLYARLAFNEAVELGERCAPVTSESVACEEGGPRSTWGVVFPPVYRSLAERACSGQLGLRGATQKRATGLAAPEITLNDALRVATVTVPAPIRTFGSRLNLCVLQLAPSTIGQINGDEGRPAACAALATLLAGGGAHPHPALREIAPGTSPVVVLTPEYAFGHSDWAEVDALVRAQQRPVVLIAGFGCTPASSVQAWAEDGGETIRGLSWTPETAQLADNRPINGGWCWIHGFGLDTLCVAFLKNHMEQRSELVALDWIQAGSHLLHLSFEDLDLLPLICADMVQTLADGNQTALHRLRDALAPGQAAGKSILVTGSLFQTEPSNANWAVAIDAWLHQVAPTRDTLLALANVAIDRPTWAEEQDAWRSLTGVFGRMTTIPKNQANLRVARNVATPNVRGAVLRLTSPYTAGGPLAWPNYGPTAEQFYWHAAMGAPLLATGIGAPILRPPEVDHVELLRFLRRAPVQGSWCPRVATGLAAVRLHLGADQAPRAAELITSLLHGVRKDARCSPDDLAKEPMGAALSQAVHSLATLLTETSAVGWRGDVGEAGQLVLQGGAANVLVWRDPELSGRRIGHALGAWVKEPEAHPLLVVLATGQYGQVEEGLVQGHPRDNISEGPDAQIPLHVAGALAEHANDITERRQVRTAAVVRLERLIELYVDYEADQDAERMAALIAQLTQAAQAA